MENKKGQVTIFIILAIAIVAVLLILFMPNIKNLIYGPTSEDFIKQCVEDSVEEIMPRIMSQGGSLEPEHYYLYDGKKIEYLCYTNDYYKKCVMQKPFLKQDIELEIDDYLKPKVEQCFASLKQQLEKRGSVVSLGKIDVKTSIIPKAIIVSVEAPFSVTKETTSKFGKFRVEKRSEIYDLIMLSSSIANWEARYGDSDPQTYMMYYPDIKVEKKKQGDGTTIYILSNRLTGEKLWFASRSLVFPEGYVEFTKQNE